LGIYIALISLIPPATTRHVKASCMKNKTTILKNVGSRLKNNNDLKEKVKY